MTTETNKARALLEASCKAFCKLAAEQSALNEKRTGSYTGTVQAAIVAGTAEAFATVYGSLKADIIGNVAGIGRKLGCKPGKTPKDGEAQAYLIPSGLATAASVVLAAMQYKISLTEKADDGSIVQRAFSAIRKDKEAADAKAKEATETPIQALQREVRETALAIAAGSNALTTLKDANDTLKILRNVLALESGAMADKPLGKTG